MIPPEQLDLVERLVRWTLALQIVCVVAMVCNAVAGIWALAEARKRMARSDADNAAWREQLQRYESQPLGLGMPPHLQRASQTGPLLQAIARHGTKRDDPPGGNS